MSILSDVLVQAGLDEKESRVYSTLLNNGGLTVVELAKKSGQKRTNLYNILNNLKHHNLVKEEKSQRTTKYFPQSPRQIEALLEQRAQMMHHAKLNYELLINSMQSQFTLIDHKPVVRYFEGVTGLRKLYDDLNDTGEDICVIRSAFDDERKDVDDIIAKQIVQQVKRGIHARVVGPYDPEAYEEVHALYTKYDEMRLVEQRFISKFPFELPAQIIIYGNKTAISTIKNEIIITILDNQDITNTYRVLFEFIWNYSTPEHNELVKDWN